jgi:UDP-glucose:(heptosyl)LPS alpha-1,3-glucosyltransferase
MKIALVIERMDVSRGGRETSTSQVASGLAAAGHEVVVLCQRGSLDSKGVEVRPLGDRGWSRTTRAGNFIQAVQQAIHSERFDIVHSMLPLPGANVYQLRGGTVPGQLRAGLRRRTPPGRLLARLTRRLNRHRLLMGRMESAVMADPRTHLLAVSEMVAAEVREHYRRTENLHVVYNAVDIPPADAEQRADWRQKLRFGMGMGSGDLLLLVVANNFELKGVAETIEALALLHRLQPNLRTRLAVVGRDPATAEGYIRAAGLRNVGPLVHILPPTREIFRWYCAADLCVLLSWYDPCSRVVLEAIRWGLPSVTTDFNGAAEVLGGGGVVVSSPAATEEVAAALDALSAPVLRQEMSRQCLQIAPRLTMRRHVDELLKVYQEILAK